MKILIATHNMKKKVELQRILTPMGIEVVTGDDLGIELSDVEETGTTFEENSLLKAQCGCDESGLPCVADDSGIAVDFLGGAPGVYSARYSGEPCDDERNNDKLLEELKDVPFDERTARYVSVVTCVFPDGKKISVRGECEGKIGFERVGNGGFGYDPLFILPDGRSFGEYTAEEKDKISHRGKALRLLAKELEKII